MKDQRALVEALWRLEVCLPIMTAQLSQEALRSWFLEEAEAIERGLDVADRRYVTGRVNSMAVNAGIVRTSGDEADQAD